MWANEDEGAGAENRKLKRLVADLALGKQILADSGLDIIPADTLGEGAQAAVAAAGRA